MLKGTKHTPESLARISESRRGKAVGNQNAKGAVRTEEFKANVSRRHIGELSHRWRGDEVGYRGVHLWIAKEKGKASVCETADLTCSDAFHWSNKSGDYLRDASDWQQLCASHHKRYDLERKR